MIFILRCLGETNIKNVHFENNPVTLIPKPPQAQNVPKRSAKIPLVVPLQETQRLQPLKPTAKRILECIQTMSGGNEETYSLHVSSETGVPHASLNLSLSTASCLDHSCSSTKIRDPQELDVFPPVEQGSGMILLMIQFSTARWKSLSVSVFTLPPSKSNSLLPASHTSLPGDALNCGSSLGSALLSLAEIFTMHPRRQGLMRQLPEMETMELLNRAPESLASRISTVFPMLSPEDATTRLLICVQVPPSMVSMPLSLRKIFASVQLKDNKLTQMLPPTMNSIYMPSQQRQTWKLPLPNTLPSLPLPVAYKPLQLAKILPPATCRVPRKTWQLSMVTVPLKPSPEATQPSLVFESYLPGEILPHVAQVRCHQSSCGAFEDGFAMPTTSSIDRYDGKHCLETAVNNHWDRLGSLLGKLKAEHELFEEQLDNSDVESKPCSLQDMISTVNDSRPLPDSSQSEKVEIYELPNAADIQDSSVFKSGM